MLFSAYRRDDFADPEGFVSQLGLILSDFPEEVVIYVTSPRTGIQRVSKWPPSVNEIVEACESHQQFLRRVRTTKPITSKLPPYERPAGYLANVHIPSSHPRYNSLCEWAKTAEAQYWKYGKSSDGVDGIWIPLSIWQDGVKAIETMKAAMPTLESLLSHYRKHNLGFVPKSEAAE